MKNAVVHFEIYADDPGPLAKFYTSLFGWNIEAAPGMEYWFVKTVETDDQGMPRTPGSINGGLMKRPEGFGGRIWIDYVNVDSVDASLARARELGATVMKEKSAVPGMGWFALVTDPQGNLFGLWQSDRGAK